MKHTIYLRSGRMFDFERIEAQVVDLDDIALGLAHTNRYNGRTPGPYSVAQHSLLVEALCFTDEGRFHGLIHDAAEAYIGDMPTPLKNMMANYRDIERRVEQRIFREFNFNPKSTLAEVKWADRRAMVIEVVQMFDHGARTAFGFTKEEVEAAKDYIAEGHYISAVGYYETAKTRWLDTLSLHNIRRYEDSKGKRRA